MEEEDRPDFTTLLRGFMAQALRTNKDLARLTGLSLNTLEKWTGGLVQRTRSAGDVLKVARALALTAPESSALLIAAGHPPLAAIQAHARQAGDAALLASLAPWQDVAAPAKPAGAVAVAAPPRAAPRHQLRPPVADFVGRAHETAHVMTAIQTALGPGCGAVISGVRGMGGIGKTELAYAVSHELRDTFPDAQIVLNLRGSSATPLTAEQAVQAIIHTFTPDAHLPETLAALEQQYRTVLHGQRALILADDAADADQVRPLLPPAGCALLLTSRQRFTLPGMKTIDLELLGEAEAVTLLRDLCGRLSRAEAQLIARACAYLPLALRISGGILHNDPALAVADYISRLADERQRLAHLRDPDNPRLDVAASLALSYAQLDAAAQRVLRQLGVFVADFTTPMALAVVEAAEGGDVEATLRRLLRRNLIMYDTARGRWHLHDLVRDLARRTLDVAEEADAAWWRYAWAAVALAQAADEQYQAGGDETWAALARFDVEQSHIDAARRWAAEHVGTAAGDALLVADALATSEIGDLRYARRHKRIPQLETALSAARRLGDRRGEAIVLNSLGMIYADMGEAGRASLYFERQLAIAQETGDQDSEARAFNNLGVSYAFLGDPQRAIRALEQRLAIAREIEDRWMVLRNLGEVYLGLGEAQRALAFLNPALTHARGRGYRWSEAMVLRTLGDAYLTLGEARRAMACFEQALAIYRTLGNRQGEGTSLCQLGRAYLALGEAQQALAHGTQALDIAREVDARRREGYALCLLGASYAALGDGAQAHAAFEAALTCLGTIGDRWGEADCKWQFGLALARQGEHQEALPLLRAAVAYEEEIGHAKAAEHAALVARLEAGAPQLPDLFPPTGQHAVEDGAARPVDDNALS